MRRSSTHISFIAVLWLLVAARPSLGGITEAEDELKSAFIFNFLRYSTWPEGVSSGPITVGVLGRPSLAVALQGFLEGKAVNGRPIRVVGLKAAADAHCCQMLYVATDKVAIVRPALENAASAHVLTVGENDHFLDYGGAINLQLVDGRMGFEFSLEALERSKIEISSKLLRLGQLRRGPFR